LCGYSI